MIAVLAVLMTLVAVGVIVHPLVTGRNEQGDREGDDRGRESRERGDRERLDDDGLADDEDD